MTTPSLLPVECDVVAHAWGVEEIREGHPARVLCECGHASPEEALACARPRSLDRLAQLAHDTYLDGYPAIELWDELTPCERAAWRRVAAAVLGVR